MASGPEMAMQGLFRVLGVDPKEMGGNISNLGKLVLEFKAQLDRIEVKLDALITTSQKGQINGPHGFGQTDTAGLERPESGAGGSDIPHGSTGTGGA